MDLFDDRGSEDETTSRLKINKQFAKSFEEKERLKELEQAKYMTDDDEDFSDSEDDESEDDDGILLSSELDIKIAQTINSIRKKDPKIYDGSSRWFEQEIDSNGDSDQSDDEPKSKKNHQKKTYKDVVREQILEEAEDEEENRKSAETGITRSKSNLMYDEEQQKLRSAFLRSVQNEAEDGSDVDQQGGIFTVKPKSKKQLEEEELELKKAVEELKKTSAKTESENYLLDYISNRKWVMDSNNAGIDYDSSDFEKEEQELDREDLFESKYNFRFEELEQGGGDAGRLHGAQVQGHSRNVEGTVRRVDDKRKLKRQEREERKAHEKRQKEEELKRLKNLKKQELRKRLQAISEVGGLRSLGIDESILDEDWDPEKHEQMMRSQFNDEYYLNSDDPNFEPVEDDEDFNQLYLDEEEEEDEINEENSDYDEQNEHHADEDIDPESSANAVKERDSILDELYQLDYEDIIDGMPCRFKYRQVQPENYGLEIDDVLSATDAELNQFVSLKKLAPYRDGKKIKENDGSTKLSKKRRKLRLAIKERVEREAIEAAAQGKQLKGTAPNESKVSNTGNEEPSDKKKKRKRRKAQDSGVNTSKEVVDFSTFEASAQEDRADEPVVKKPKKKKSDKSSSQNSNRMNLLK